MNLIELSVIFTFGLVSSLHCVGMCGPIVLTYGISLNRRSYGRQALSHLSYNAGRILTYSVLGAVAGLAGKTLGLIGHLAGVEQVAALVAGGLMILAGLFMLDLLPDNVLRRFDPLRYTSSFLRPLGSRVSSPSVSSKFTLGLMLGFLPCGLIYAALLKSMATGTAFAGALTMMAFGLGTALSLIGLGLFSTVFSSSLARVNPGRWGTRLTAIGVALLGFLLVWRGLMPIMEAQTSASGAANCHDQ